MKSRLVFFIWPWNIESIAYIIDWLILVIRIFSKFYFSLGNSSVKYFATKMTSLKQDDCLELSNNGRFTWFIPIDASFKVRRLIKIVFFVNYEYNFNHYLELRFAFAWWRSSEITCCSWSGNNLKYFIIRRRSIQHLLNLYFLSSGIIYQTKEKKTWNWGNMSTWWQKPITDVTLCQHQDVGWGWRQCCAKFYSCWKHPAQVNYKNIWLKRKKISRSN